MGLAERIVQHQRHEAGAPEPPASPPTAPPADDAPAPGPLQGAERFRASARMSGDRVREVRLRLHRQLLDLLGPTLYDEQLDTEELAARIRRNIGELLAQ